MQVVSNTPLIGEESFDDAAKKFFEQIGYLSKGSDHAVPFKIFSDFYIFGSCLPSTFFAYLHLPDFT